MTSGKRRKGFDDLIARRDEFTDVSPPWDSVEPEPAASTPVAASTPAAIPAPYETTATGELTARERDDLATCEAALDGLRIAFWAAGKALQVIRDARLYRETHDTFEAYLTDRWEIQTSQAYRLIAAWPLAEALSPMGDKINERQVRELTPVAERYSVEAATTVYRIVAETAAEIDGVRVTAAVLHDAVNALPDSKTFDEAKAAARIRACLNGEIGPDPAPTPDPVELFSHEVDRVRTMLRRAFRPETVRTVATKHPDQVHRFAEELRTLADELDAGTGPS